MFNLSNNDLYGSIPSNLRDLTVLESMDLWHNLLLCEIHCVFQVSHNQLEFHTLEGKQFDTFENDWYAGNSGLCRHPLTRKCQDPKAPSPQLPNSGKLHSKHFTLDTSCSPWTSKFPFPWRKFHRKSWSQCCHSIYAQLYKPTSESIGGSEIS